MAPELELTGVDVVERPADLPASINWTQSPGGAALPETVDCLTDSLVFAHEWLDVVPCEIAVRESSQWHVVGVDQDGSLQPHRSLTDAERQWCERFWPSPGDVMEIGLSRDQAYAGLRARLRSGLLVCVDYGHLAGGRPPERTLVGYRDGSICQPRFDGSTDLTAHVAVDSLGADRVTRQRDIALELLEPPPRPGHSLASTDPATYLAALRRRSAWTTLTAPTGLGGFWWTLEPVDGSATNSSAAAAN